MNGHVNRSFSRLPCKGLIELFIRNNKFNNCYSPGWIRNCDKGGMYFETNNPIEPGSNISIKIPNKPGDHKSKVSRVHYARVRWCRKNAEKKRYDIGVQIFETVVQATIPEKSLLFS